MKNSYYKTATIRRKRTLVVSDEKVSLCVPIPILRALLGFLDTLETHYEPDDIEQVSEYVSDVFESAIQAVPCSWGTTFRTVDTMLEEQQSQVSPPPPWEYRVQDRALEFRTKES